MATLVKLRGLERARPAADKGVLSRGFRVKSAWGPVYPQGTKATKTIGTGNAQVKYTASVGGTWANSKIKIAHVNSAPLAVLNTFDSSGVLTVTVNIDAGTTTANQVIAAVNADPLAKAYVTASVGTGTGASAAVAGAAAVMTGGANTGTSEKLWVVANADRVVIVDITDREVQRILKRNRYRVEITDVA